MSNSSPDSIVATAEPRRFIKARPLAAQLSVCRRTIFRWADQGLIARHKVNSRVVLFDVREVENFITRCRAA